VTSAAELVALFGSPLFVYDGELVERRHAALRSALPEGADLFYAVKANPSLGLLALLRRLGAGAEIASEGELLAARRAGFEASAILFAGPGKRDDELRAAVEAGLLGIHVESEGELRRLDAIGRARGRRVRVGVRAHVPWSAGEGHVIIGGGEATKFGIPAPVVREAARAWLGLEGVELSGLHVFNASNVLDAGALVRGARRTLELATELVAAGWPLEWVDAGGGLGVPYAPGETPLDVEALGRGLGAALAEARRASGRDLRLVLEPGRWLVAEAGRLLLRVLDRKACGGVEFLVVDGGVHDLLRPALIGQPHPIACLRASPAAPRAFRVVGPLCTSLDSFGDHALPEDVTRGDLLSIGCAGAYGFTEAMPHFLSHPVPAEVLLWRGAAHLLRPRREAAWHLEGQAIPPALGD
jgi:diaminopimelate decarboxylase